MAVTHVIGAGMAGLSAAVELAQSGARVVVYEGGTAAGGRCRSYFDRGMGCRLDNGNHLLMSGNLSVMGYLDRIGARTSLSGPGESRYHFMDLGSGENWTLSPNVGRIPWWVLQKATRIPGTRLRDYLGLLRLKGAGVEATVAGLLSGHTGSVYARMIEPLAIAALNTRPEIGLARLLFAVMEETLMLGGAACIPSFPRIGLSESFVDPALAFLRERGATIHLARRAVALDREAERVTAIRFLDETVPVADGDRVVLAVPPWIADDLLPGLGAPGEFESILNVHFRTDLPIPDHWRGGGFVGLIGGTAEWVFAKSGVVSVTVSAANHLLDVPNEELARRAWSDVSRALGITAPMPPRRVLKEKRATFAATAAQERRRPGTRTALRNLVLAGDWTATGLPATIEGAIRSGRVAADTLRAAA